MGIRINTNTWRAPLQLIDSWLPAPAHRTAVHRGLPQLFQRFSRAGWLGRNRVMSPMETTATGGSAPLGATSPRVCRVQVMRAANSGLRNDTRMVISGRMADVCAELDRLAAQEHPSAETAACT
ncbi:MAG: hypothetical protein IV088_01820 [Hydrogenophaga sp.]|uniref:hypothetical protein n=1 Tax=Hydrogenophaga sp. TaxID=1904254 RepID=UPI0025B9F0B9|nr:hypothetical protein [Hydrogenophaga sp.]MBT9549560.1 hypothetical protein [Hydrogenophaga sp.]